ncbi:uncharacterized protein PFLUO_LOCUS9511 [Penicillium psychrofluorescens]|uniref:uncharacterized protein n=1 Tax=Penicillium psychrofluorescens TaxID=3158075 RepID=UPI003CCDF91F
MANSIARKRRVSQGSSLFCSPRKARKGDSPTNRSVGHSESVAAIEPQSDAEPATPGRFIENSDADNSSDSDTLSTLFLDMSPFRGAREAFHAFQKPLQELTLKHLDFFANNTVDKHYMAMDIAPLTGKDNFAEWAVKMECLLKMRQVWAVVDAQLEPLPANHESFLVYHHMETVALTCILSHLAPNVYDDMIQQAWQRNPVSLWYSLGVQYGY